MTYSPLRVKSFRFALDSIQVCKQLKSRKEFVLSDQLLRSSTSVGANIREAQNAQSTRDFIHKLSISQKECDESIYWLELLRESEYIDQEQFANLGDQATELLRMLRSSIITSKKRIS